MKNNDLIEEYKKIQKKSEIEAERSLINRWIKNLQKMNIPYFDILYKDYKKDLNVVIKEIIEFMKEKNGEKFVFLGEKSRSYATLKKLEDLNGFLLKNFISSSKEKEYKEDMKNIQNLKGEILNSLRFDKEKDLYSILQQLRNTFEPLNELVDSLDDDCEESLFKSEITEFLLATDDIFNTSFIQLLIYRIVHMGVSKDVRLSILKEIHEKLIKENQKLQKTKTKEECNHDIKIKSKQIKKKDIYIILYKFFTRYKRIYQGELLKEIQKIIVNDSSFEFENIPILEIIEYFDSLEQKEGESKLTSSWIEKEMLQKLSSENKKRDNLLKQKIGIIDEIIELMRYSQGRNLDAKNFKNIKVIYHEFFKNNVKLPSSRCTPKQQLLNFYKFATSKRKDYEKLYFELTKNKKIEENNYIFSKLTDESIGNLNKQFNEISSALLNFFTKEELTFFSEKITRGHYISEDMAEEYKLLKNIEWELITLKSLIFSFKSEEIALIEIEFFIREIFFFIELLVGEYKLNDYRSISINEIL